ncbi:hypothetical protein AB833_03340 [Chromatiales bacterium (ex Bugula neritina AB1)]|nr:hypothetical protein AB833_03340 [Chromatiales bacterium (ex Bugula neritina AB1)]
MKYRNVIVASLVTGVMTGCSVLPTGFSSRSKDSVNVEDLFVSDSESQATAADAEKNRKMAVAASGLTVRKSKRGNMASYVVRGQRYHTLESSKGYSARGLASWYGPNFHGRTASNGEVYDMYKMTAAHKSLPLPTYARVTHIDNGKSVIVKINDRGPFSGERIIDLSFAAALQLGMVNDGTAMVEIQALSAEELAVMSGPTNTMGIEFDYIKDGVTTPVAPSALAGLAEATKLPNVEMGPGAVSVDGDVVEIPALTDAGSAGQVVPIVEEPEVSTAMVVTDVVESDVIATDVVVPIATARSESVEVPVATGDGVAVAVPPMFPPENENGEAVSIAAAADSDPNVGLPVALVDASSLGQAVAVAGLPAMQTADGVKKSDKLKTTGIEYYIQAGVFANVQDAENLAVDIVSAIPREEVHVKPLKNTAMFRVTVGPIMQKEHAKTVSAELDQAGFENYTVKVKEL